jgi:hypothetical protein
VDLSRLSCLFRTFLDTTRPSGKPGLGSSSRFRAQAASILGNRSVIANDMTEASGRRTAHEEVPALATVLRLPCSSSRPRSVLPSLARAGGLPRFTAPSSSAELSIPAHNKKILRTPMSFSRHAGFTQ